MDSTNDRAKHIIDRYREGKSLRTDVRRRVGREIERRIEYGELSVLNINTDLPKLPSPRPFIASSTVAVATKTGVAVIVAATSAVMAWRGVIASSKSETASRSTVKTAISAPQPSPSSAVHLMASPSLTIPSASPTAEKITDQGALATRKPVIARDIKNRSRPPRLLPLADKPVTNTSAAEHPIKRTSDLYEFVSAIVPLLDNNINAIDGHSDVASAEALSPPINAQKPTEETRPPASLQRPGRSLDEEVKLLQSAYASLRARQPERALAQLAEHTWRFPRGELAESRDVARILALCRAGKSEASRAEAARFLSERPHSPFAARVRSICVQPEEAVH
jgi:hypothetical protein